MRIASTAFALLLGVAVATAARAVSLDQIASDAGLTAAERAQLEQGQVVSRTLDSSNPRELAVGLAVKIMLPPAKLAQELFDGLALREMPDLMARGPITSGALSEFAGVKLDAATAQAYLAAQPGQALNLSSEEIAAFQALAGQPGDPVAIVTPAVHQQLQARFQSYLAKGLAGIAPYARGSRSESPADDLRAATLANELFAKYAPSLVRALTADTGAAPAGGSQRFLWMTINADNRPTFVLSRFLSLPEGAAWSLANREYYVSRSYNAQQGLLLLVPSDDGGSYAVLATRVSTDQVAGFGGGAKRSIGSRMMASTLTTLADRTRKAAGGN